MSVPAATHHDTTARLRIAVQRLARLLRPTEAGAAAELTPTRVAVLLNVVRNGPVRLAQIAREEGLNPTLLSRTLSWLAESGLIVRSADPEDRRSAWLEPTDAGREIACAIREERSRALEAALGELSADERSAIEAALPALEALNERLRR